MSNRAIKREVWKKINANRQRAADVLRQDEREREALRELNRKASEQAAKCPLQKVVHAPRAATYQKVQGCPSA
jgi:hypothetical protein